MGVRGVPAASGDNHPVHYDAEYCRAWDAGMLAHGFQTLIQRRRGAVSVRHGGSVGWVPGTVQRFLQPCLWEIRCTRAGVDEVAPNRSPGGGLRSTVFNQRGELVLEDGSGICCAEPLPRERKLTSPAERRGRDARIEGEGDREHVLPRQRASDHPHPRALRALDLSRSRGELGYADYLGRGHHHLAVFHRGICST